MGWTHMLFSLWTFLHGFSISRKKYKHGKRRQDYRIRSSTRTLTKKLLILSWKKSTITQKRKLKRRNRNETTKIDKKKQCRKIFQVENSNAAIKTKSNENCFSLSKKATQETAKKVQAQKCTKNSEHERRKKCPTKMIKKNWNKENTEQERQRGRKMLKTLCTRGWNYFTFLSYQTQNEWTFRETKLWTRIVYSSLIRSILKF